MVAPEMVTYLAERGFSPEYGVRPLKRLIQTKILNPVAEFIISRRLANGGLVTITMKAGEPNIELTKAYPGARPGRRAKKDQPEEELESEVKSTHAMAGK